MNGEGEEKEEEKEEEEEEEEERQEQKGGTQRGGGGGAENKHTDLKYSFKSKRNTKRRRTEEHKKRIERKENTTRWTPSFSHTYHATVELGRNIGANAVQVKAWLTLQVRWLRRRPEHVHGVMISSLSCALSWRVFCYQTMCHRCHHNFPAELDDPWR